MFARPIAWGVATAVAMTAPAVAQDRFGGILAVALARVIDARDAGANVEAPPAPNPSQEEATSSDLAAVLSTKAITSATAR